MGQIPDPATPAGPGILLVGAYPQTPVTIHQVFTKFRYAYLVK